MCLNRIKNENKNAFSSKYWSNAMFTGYKKAGSLFSAPQCTSTCPHTEYLLACVHLAWPVQICVEHVKWERPGFLLGYLLFFYVGRKGEAKFPCHVRNSISQTRDPSQYIWFLGSENNGKPISNVQRKR